MGPNNSIAFQIVITKTFFFFFLSISFSACCSTGEGGKVARVTVLATIDSALYLFLPADSLPSVAGPSARKRLWPSSLSINTSSEQSILITEWGSICLEHKLGFSIWPTQVSGKRQEPSVCLTLSILCCSCSGHPQIPSGGLIATPPPKSHFKEPLFLIPKAYAYTSWDLSLPGKAQPQTCPGTGVGGLSGSTFGLITSQLLNG